jgi:hypothetical protein
MSLSLPPKDPDEVLDYTVDWSQRLDGDTISTSAFTFETQAGLVKNTDSKTTTTTTVWLSAGTIDLTGVILNRIVTTGGRTMDQSLKLKLKAK